MFSQNRYSRLTDEVINKRTLICESREKAYNYYADVFKKDYPKKSVKGEVLYLYTNTPYELNQAQYMFYDFDTVDIGRPVALSETDYLVVEDVCINYCSFQNCNIKNIIFRSCSFSGTNFSSIQFDHVIFDSCFFSVPVMENGRVGIDDIYHAPTLFNACTFVGTFSNCDIEHSLFEKVCFTLSKFEKCSLQASVFNMCALSSVDIKDCNMSSFGMPNNYVVMNSEEMTYVDGGATFRGSAALFELTNMLGVVLGYAGSVGALAKVLGGGLVASGTGIGCKRNHVGIS
ncbi:MAG: hypothetical protein EOM11_06855 [Erysipelotrichia bacterium]|nr:hypothetical protein [Erysipelotrichia bacterium]